MRRQPQQLSYLNLSFEYRELRVGIRGEKRALSASKKKKVNVLSGKYFGHCIPQPRTNYLGTERVELAALEVGADISKRSKSRKFRAEKILPLAWLNGFGHQRSVLSFQMVLVVVVVLLLDVVSLAHGHQDFLRLGIGDLRCF